MPERSRAHALVDAGAVETVEAAIEVLRSSGGRVTAAKRRIIELLHGASTPLTAEEVHNLVPDADQASVYRSLAQLEELGVIWHRHLGHGPAMYRWAGVATLPIVCDGCGAIVELGPSDYKALAQSARQRGMTLLAGHVALSGRCDRCARGN